MKIRLYALCLMTCLSASCAITYLQHNSEHLQPAIEAYAARDYEACDNLLDVYETDDFVLGLQHQYAFYRGMSAHHNGKMSVAIDYLSEYLELPGAVPARMREVETILLDYADRYIDGRLRVLWVFKSPTNGYSILETLATFAHSLEVQARSMARLAEYYLAEGRVSVASTYYAMLLNPRYAALGWDDRASFRYAECRYLMLRDQKSDEQSILVAYKSSKSYLDNYPAGLNRVDAQAIADDCITRYAELHLSIGEYYRTIGNQIGAIHHLKLASGQESQGVVALQGAIPRDHPVAILATESLASYEN
ncbi:MAG: hypothetical protein QGF46_06500 [Planctomycetota bacterium]|jgi:hypothetical protein|nr:hypothetical protein [Planctomycetota bacterium]